MKPVKADGQAIPGEIQNFIEQLHDDDDFFRQYLHLPDDEPPAYVQPSVDGRDDSSTYLGSEGRAPSLTFGQTLSSSSRSTAPPSSPGKEAIPQDPLKASLAKSPQASPGSHFSEHDERQTPPMGTSNDTGDDSPARNRQQMSKAGVSFHGEQTMERHDFIIEELSDFDENDMDGRDDVLAPHLIEYAESDLSESHIDVQVINDLRDLNFRSPDADPLSDDADSSDEEYQELLRQRRVQRRRKRIASGSMGKRTMSERSDSDREDLRHALDFDQVGSSARRLKRRVGDRRSLIFQEPPPKIDEIDEPSEELEDTEMLTRELPFYAFTTMEVDSPWTSTFDVSVITPDSIQDPEGNERAPKGKETTHANPSLKKESGLPRTAGENEKVADEEDETRSDRGSCADETMSVQSYADSLFDSVSVGSSASSLYSDTQAFVQEYVDFLVGDPGLEKLFMRSMSPTVLGPERFRRNYSKILQSYARDLKRQPASWNDEKSTLYTPGLDFISRRSITMKTASLIASRYMEKSPRTQVRPGRAEDEGNEALDLEAEFEHDTSSGDESPGNEPCHSFMISELRFYFREGAPFQRMKRNLRNLVIPNTAMSRVKLSTERMLDLLLGDEYLRFLLLKALSDPLAPLRDNQFDPERGIRYFGSRLKAEAGSLDILRVAEFLETYAEYIGIRAVKRMQAMDMDSVLQRQEKFINHKKCIIIVEKSTRLQQPQTYMEHRQFLTSSLSRAGEDSSSQNTTRAGRGFLSAFVKKFEYLFQFGMAILKPTLLGVVVLCVYGVVFKDVLDHVNQDPIVLSVIGYIIVYLFWNELDNTIAPLLWYQSSASKKGRGKGREILQYFKYKWSIGDGDDIGQKLQSHLWKPYKLYLSSKPDEVLETIVDDNLPNLCDADIDTHWHAVASSKIFQEFVDRVRDVAIPTFFSEAKRLVSEGLVGDEDPGSEAGKISLLRSLAEVQWCFMHTGVAPTMRIFTSPRLKDFHLLNLIKLSVEASSRSEWQWWPLQPPNARGKVRDSDCRISWKCSCGTEREELVPFVYASKLSHLASQFALSNEPPERPPSSLSSVSSQATRATSASESQSTSSSPSSAAGSSSLRSSTAATSTSSSVISFGTPPKAFVFLVVKASRYTLAAIDVTEKKARDFFQAIVENYNKNRGWWRRLLSIYVYSHCDFVKIKRYAPQSFDPGLRFSFPPHDESPYDKEYGYYPRPMPHAPVSRHMFNHMYNACYSDQGLAHKLHYAFTAPSCIIKTIPGKLLDGMPKRDRLVDEEAEFSEEQDVEVFWGLVAREQRSALRVVIYMLLGLGPSLWFMFQWLFGWGHDGDLQDATVPLTFSATMLGILWAVVYSGDDVREVEQPL